MDQNETPKSAKRLICRYVVALDSGDLDEIEMILKAAQLDPILDRMIAEVNAEYATELGLTKLAEDAQEVATLVEEIFTQDEEMIEQPLTVGEVAAHLVNDQELPKKTRDLGKTLLTNPVTLPDWLSIQEARKLMGRMRIWDEQFLRAFRDAALQILMGRGQAQMAATRAKRSRRSNYRGQPGNPRHKNKD